MLGFSPYSATAFSDLGTTEQLFVATGTVGNGAIGTASVTGNQSGLTLGSVQGSAVVNDVSVDAGATAAVSLQTRAVGDVGTVISSTDLSIIPTGVVGTGVTPSVSVLNASVISPTGVHATGDVGSLSTTATATISITGVSGAMGLGTAQGQAGAGADVTGVSATVSVGSITMTGTGLITPIGVSAEGSVGQALVWGDIKPNPGTVWTRIAA
jgi:hypothetical protein